MTKINDDYIHNFIKRQEYKLQGKIWNAKANQLDEKLDKIRRFSAF